MKEKQINTEDQINLSAFKNFFISLLVFFFDFLSFAYISALKKKWFLIIGLLIGISIGFLYQTTRPKLFNASMLVKFNILTYKTYAELLGQLNNLIALSSIDEASKELNISRDLIKNITSIEAKNINNVSLVKDTSTKTNIPFKIIIYLTDNTNIDSIQNSIISYLNNRPYLKKISDQEKKINEEKLRFINNELNKLDSLKTEVNRFLSTSRVSTTFYNNAINPAEIYSHSISLMAQKENTERALYIFNYPLLLVDGFKVSRLPQTIPLHYILFLLGSAGLFAGFLVGLLIETKKNIMPQLPDTNLKNP